MLSRLHVLVDSWRSHPVLAGAGRIAIATRLAIFFVGYLAVSTIGHDPAIGPQDSGELLNLPDRWDASWYLGIASGGYRYEPGARNQRLAFFPALPMTIRFVARSLGIPERQGPWLWTGVLLSCLFFWIGLVYLAKLSVLLGGSSTAETAGWLLACYPFSLFYGQVYTESLFLVGVAGSWYYICRDRPLVSALFGLGVGLVRPTGCLVSLIIGWVVWERLRRSGPGGATWKSGLAVLAPVAGLGIYAAYVKRLTGEWLMWMSVQRNWGREPRNPIDLVSDMWSAIGDQGLGAFVLARPYDCVNGAAAVFGLISVVPVARRYGAGAAAFVLASLMIPLTAGGLLSIGRFTSVLVPTFLWLGARSRQPNTLLVCFALLQGLLAALFFTDRGIY